MTKIGKRVVDELYLHLSALDRLENQKQKEEIRRRMTYIPKDETQPPNVVKFNLKTGRLSLLNYPTFEEEAFPELRASWSFKDGSVSVATYRSYDQSLNPPILHRKEMLVAEDYPSRPVWIELTNTAEALGLFDDTTTIGFKLNWQRLIARKGFRFDGQQFVPIGNDVGGDSNEQGGESADDIRINRHLTALKRTGLSAPVQLILRHGLLSPEDTFFDYGCGRGQDVAGLTANGFTARGWDPYYAPENLLEEANVVNLGFVVNVIEDPAERVDAVRRAFQLTRSVLSIGVMLYGSDIGGQPYLDGYRTSRNTFQKYFTQQEFKDFLEQILHREPFMVAPGIAFVFADPDVEQRFICGRYRSRNIVRRAHVERRPALVTRRTASVERRLNKAERNAADARPTLDALWTRSLEFGRYPDEDEIQDLCEAISLVGRYNKVLRIMMTNYDQSVLASAARIRTDDLRLYFAMQRFSKRSPYRTLERRLQRDIRCFLGDYSAANDAGLALLKEANDPAVLYDCCQAAATNGLGWLDGQSSLQIHSSLVDRLPAPLRAYVGCGLQLYGELGDVQLIKIHIRSGKLSLLEYEGFDATPLPLLKTRVKVNIRKLDYDVFEYGSLEYPKPYLYWKSRYLSEDYPGYADQLAFDEALENTGLLGPSEYGPTASALNELLEAKRLMIDGFRLTKSNRIPYLDESCGRHFIYRNFIECGKTQGVLKIRNLPKSPDSYNAIYDLATQILDPIIEYFGAIQLTYGFSSPSLSSKIEEHIAPKVDQHACCETTLRGNLICERRGAACDFLVADEDMQEVAEWIIENLPFDRIYFYGRDRPLHVSYGPEHSRIAYRFELTRAGRMIPRAYIPRRKNQ